MLTTGQPQAMASMRTVGSASCLDERTNRSAFARKAKGFSLKPGKSTDSSMPSRLANRQELRFHAPISEHEEPSGAVCQQPSEGGEQERKILPLVQLSDGQDDREFRAVQPGMIRRLARPAFDILGDDRIIDHLRMAALQARDLRKFGRHSMGDSHDGVRVRIGTACTAKQATSIQGFVQCRDRTYGTLCDMRGHCCRRCCEDVHGEERVRSFTVQVCRHA